MLPEILAFSICHRFSFETINLVTLKLAPLLAIASRSCVAICVPACSLGVWMQIQKFGRPICADTNSVFLVDCRVKIRLCSLVQLSKI
jgi:hypothetical protein